MRSLVYATSSLKEMDLMSFDFTVISPFSFFGASFCRSGFSFRVLISLVKCNMYFTEIITEQDKRNKKIKDISPNAGDADRRFSITRY